MSAFVRGVYTIYVLLVPTRRNRSGGGVCAFVKGREERLCV